MVMIYMTSSEIDELTLFYLLKLYYEPISTTIYNKYRYRTKVMISNKSFKFCKSIIYNNTNHVFIDKKRHKIENIYNIIHDEYYDVFNLSKTINFERYGAIPNPDKFCRRPAQAGIVNID